jgi:D-alanyl-D-alanine carboxypeptidase/D-alanyl-D-alanine-endopeptidase (penicillin-binding protein 4)
MLYGENFSRRSFLTALAAAGVIFVHPAMANAPLVSLRPLARPSTSERASVQAADAIMAGARLSGDIGFAVLDGRTGAVLQSHMPHVAHPPASVTKALTALYALDVFGPSHRFRTRFMATAPIVEGVLAGDLILLGGGDPVLDTDALGDLARALQQSGLRSVQGQFLVSTGLMPELDQIDPDQVVEAGYNPAVSGMNLNFNRVHFEWARRNGDYSVTMDARAARFQPAVAMAAMEIADRDAPVYTLDTSAGHDSWTVARSALGDGGARWLPIRQPALYAGDVFRTLARAEGITMAAPELTDEQAPVGTLLAEHVSPPLNEILRGMLRYSTNLTAEVIGLSASIARGGAPASLADSAQQMNDWVRARYGLLTPVFVDHSGLSALSRISTLDLARFFQRSGADGALTPLLRDHPMRETARQAAPDHPASVQAKTGTLNFVSALGGHLTTSDGRDLAFAIVVADLPRRAAIPVLERENPRGVSRWTAGARSIQHDLLEQWAATYP